MAKVARERAVREKRERKKEKKDARKLAKEQGALELPTEEGSEGAGLSEVAGAGFEPATSGL